MDSIQKLLTLEEVELIAKGELLHAGGSITNADTFIVPSEEGPVLLKSLKRRPWLVRVVFARKTLRHESSALRQLQGLQGIPKLYGNVGKDTLVLEYIEGDGPLQDSRELQTHQYPPKDFFLRLRDLVNAMHRRGFGHGDMRRRNILLGKGMQPHLIDFATAVNRRGPLPWVRHRLFTMYREADLFSLAKMIRSYYPDLLDEDDEKRLRDIPWYLQAGRFFRKRVYRRFIKQKRWRERWNRLLKNDCGQEEGHA